MNRNSGGGQMADGAFNDWNQVLDGLPHPLTAIAPVSLGCLLRNSARRFPEARYLSLGDQSLTYGASDALVASLAADLQTLGVAPGSRVGLCLPTHPAYVLAVHALWRLGAVGVAMNPLYAAPMLQHIAIDAGVRLILTTDAPATLEKVRAAARGAGSPVVVFRHDGADLQPAIALFVPGRVPTENPPPLDGDPADRLAMIQYTGGTTGEPKGVMLSHANLCAACVQQRTRFRGLSAGREVTFVAMPLAHIGSLLAGLIFTTAIAGELVLMERLVADEAVKLIAARGVTYIPGAPTLLIALKDAPGAAAADWSALREVLSAAAPTPAEVKQAFAALTGASVRNCYGATETGPGIAMQEEGPDALEDTSCGVPFPLTQVTIRDPQDPACEVPSGEIGEICVAGPQVMRGYWKRPDATAAAFVDSFFRTGDLGRLDADGRLHLVDRLKDVINVSGYKVYPRLIEEEVYRHPAIAEVLAIGVPDAYRGETIKLFAVLKPGQRLQIAELQAFLAPRLSPMEMPKLLELRTELPKTAVGKLSRQELRRELTASSAWPRPPAQTPFHPTPEDT